VFVKPESKTQQLIAKSGMLRTAQIPGLKGIQRVKCHSRKGKL